MLSRRSPRPLPPTPLPPGRSRRRPSQADRPLTRGQAGARSVGVCWPSSSARTASAAATRARSDRWSSRSAAVTYSSRMPTIDSSSSRARSLRRPAALSWSTVPWYSIPTCNGRKYQSTHRCGVTQTWGSGGGSKRDSRWPRPRSPSPVARWRSSSVSCRRRGSSPRSPSARSRRCRTPGWRRPVQRSRSCARRRPLGGGCGSSRHDSSSASVGAATRISPSAQVGLDGSRSRRSGTPRPRRRRPGGTAIAALSPRATPSRSSSRRAAGPVRTALSPARSDAATAAWHGCGALPRTRYTPRCTRVNRAPVSTLSAVIGSSVDATWRRASRPSWSRASSRSWSGIGIRAGCRVARVSGTGCSRPVDSPRTCAQARRSDGREGRTGTEPMTPTVPCVPGGT